MHQLANKLKDDFGFNSIRFEVIEKGALSQNYVVKTAEAQFFLKQYRFKSIEPVQVAHRAKFFFAEVGVPVILPLTSQVGKTFFQVEGNFMLCFLGLTECSLNGALYHFRPLKRWVRC